MAPASGGRKRRPWVLAAVAAGFLAAAVVATVIIIHYTDKDGKKHEQTVQLPPGAINPEVVIKPGDAPAAIPTGEPMSPLALVRKPAKIAGVESWSVETIGPRGDALCYLSPDGGQVASFGLDGVIRVWNTGDGRLIKVLLGNEVGPWPAHASPVTRLVARRSTLGLLRQQGHYDLGRSHRQGPAHRIQSVGLVDCVVPGWKDLGNGPRERRGRNLVNASTGEKIDIIRAQYVDVNQIAWSPSSSKLR